MSFFILCWFLHLSNENCNIHSKIFLLGVHIQSKHQINSYNLLSFPLLSINSTSLSLDFRIWMYQMLIFFWIISFQNVMPEGTSVFTNILREAVLLKTTWDWNENKFAWNLRVLPFIDGKTAHAPFLPELQFFSV